MRGRGQGRNPGARGPVRRRKAAPKKRGISDAGKVAIAAMVASAIAFGAVLIDWSNFSLPSIASKPSAMGTDTPTSTASVSSAPEPGVPLATAMHAMGSGDVKAVVMQIAGKGGPSKPEELARKATAIKVLGLGAGGSKVQLAGARLHLEAPKGHCFLDSAQPGDARLIGVLSKIYLGELRILSGFAECGQLKAWRTGERKTLGFYGDFLVFASLVDKTAKASSTKTLVDVACKAMRDYNGEFKGLREVGLKQRIEQALENSRVNEVRFLGVIHQDDSACYFSTLQKIATEDGSMKTQIDVVTIGIVGGKMLYMDLYSVLESDKTMLELLDRQRANIVRNVTANAANGT